MGRARTLAVASCLWLGLAAGAQAARLITVPFAETIDQGRYSLWQFGLYEQRGNKHWRSLNRLDLGVYEGAELGVFVISPKDKQPDTWVNLQYRPLKEGDYAPAVAVGIWDVLRKGAPLFSDRAIGPSPFLAVSKGVKRGDRYAKLGLNLGANRLDGLSGGLDLRFLKGTGAMLEFAPRNLRSAGADAWDAGLYHWLGKYVRVRVSRVGGNPMVDGFFTYAFGPAKG